MNQSSGISVAQGLVSADEVEIANGIYEFGEERKKSWTQVPVQATGKLAATSRVHPFCNLQTRAGTHAVLAIGLYEPFDMLRCEINAFMNYAPFS
jgi:hypothetical protein